MIKIAHIINGKKIETNLCRSCAEQKGVDNPLATLPNMFGNFIAEFLGQDALKRKKSHDGRKCPGCGASWEAFEKTGLFGCGLCYETFLEDLNTVLRRIHGSNQHIGSCPKSFRHVVDQSKIQNFRSQLDRAIKSENFEKAAVLRDIIRDAEREIDKGEHEDGILR
ncbi:MAG TPA: UvrB/UvrC motif-containing protein [bacterium]